MKRRSFLKETSIVAAGSLFIPSILIAGRRRFFDDAISLNTEINAKAAGKPFAHFWSKCVGAGRAKEGLQAEWLEQLKLTKQNCGFEYCRFHGLFHDDMFVYKEVNGKPVYNWQYIDALFDRMLAIGVRPFVELGFMPKQLASTENTTFWWKANTSPPKNYAAWGEFITQFVKHCVARYGLAEIQSWYFEVWNEPDLHGFWDGTKSQYFELYKTSANAVKAVDSSLRVGGPATSNFVPDERFDGEVEDKTKHKTLTVKDINALEWRGVWIKDFLTYCTKEQLPVDFVSTHPYPTDWAIDPDSKKGAGRVRRVNATQEDLQWLKQTVKESHYPNAQIHCTEWSSSPSSRDPTHDSLQAATYIIKANLDSIGLVNSLSYWTFTDVFEETGAGDTIFHGGFGLINYQGIVKPGFHAYRMLNRLGDEIIHREEGLIVTRFAATGKISALLYHYPEEVKDVVSGSVEGLLETGKAKTFAIQFQSLKRAAAIKTELLDKEHGFAYLKWKTMGKPEPPTRKQVAELKAAAWETKKNTFKADSKGHFTFKTVLQPWNCLLLTTD